MHAALPKTLPLALATLAGTLSGGCILFQPYVTDLKLIRVEPTHARHWNATSEQTRDLKITFTTARNLASLGGYGYPRAEAGLCPDGTSESLRTSFITANGVDIERFRDAGPGTYPIEYETVISFDPEQYFANIPASSRQGVVDLCFKVSAGSYFGSGGFDSRPIVIPKAAIEAALEAPAAR